MIELISQAKILQNENQIDTLSFNSKKTFSFKESCEKVNGNIRLYYVQKQPPELFYKNRKIPLLEKNTRKNTFVGVFFNIDAG